jgi:iron complex outermembrane recepter protein
MMKKQLLLLAFFTCRQVALFSQYSVSGTVKDGSGNALIGANVVVAETSYGTATNLNGEFNLRGLKSGDYVLNVSFLGYESVNKEVKVSADVRLEIVLNPKNFMADEVIISAIRASGNMPVTKSVISRDEINKRNLGQDVPYLMALTPSLVTTSDAGTGIGYTNFRIRGTDMNRINVTINGIPLNDAESHSVYWVDLPDFASSIENIQIQRGVGTSTQGGGAFGATINLQTLNLNKKAYAELSNSAGSFNTFKNSVSFGTGLIDDHFTFDGRLSRVSSDGYIDRAFSDLKSFYLSGAYYTENTLLKLIVSSGYEETYQAWQGVPKAKLDNDRAGMLNYLAVQADWKEIDGNRDDSLNMFQSDPRKYNMYRYKNQVDHYNQDHYQVLFSHSFSKLFSINTAIHYTRGKGYYEQYKPRQKFSNYGLDNVIIGEDTIRKTNLIRRKWLDNHFYGITWSLNYTNNQINGIIGGGWNKYEGEHYGKLRWAQFMSNGELDQQYYFNEGEKTDFNVFTKVNYRVNNDLSVFGDLQLRRVNHSIEGLDNDFRDITQDHTFTFFNPKAGLNYSLNENNNVYGYVGIAHREPNRDNFVDADPSKPAPKAEKLTDYELGYNFKSANAAVGINFYYMYYDNQLVLTGRLNDVGNPVMTNVGESYRSGVEVTTSIKIFERLTWNGNATLSRNIIKNFTEYVDNYDTWVQDETYHKETKLAFSPEFIAGSQFTYSFKPLSVSLISKYVGKQYIDNTASNLRKLDPYFVNDIRLNANFMVKSICAIDAIISINNVLNEKYETNAWVSRYIEGGESKTIDGYFPQAGRNFMAGLVIKF